MISRLKQPIDEARLPDIMRDYFVLKKRERPVSRASVYLLYAVGFTLLAVPAVLTFFSVVAHVLSTVG